MVVMCGSTTVWVIEAASAASQAFPPRFRMSMAARVASGCEVIAIPPAPSAGAFFPKWASSMRRRRSAASGVAAARDAGSVAPAMPAAVAPRNVLRDVRSFMGDLRGEARTYQSHVRVVFRKFLAPPGFEAVRGATLAWRRVIGAGFALPRDAGRRPALRAGALSLYGLSKSGRRRLRTQSNPGSSSSARS